MSHLWEHRGWHSFAVQLIGLASLAFVIGDQVAHGVGRHTLWLLVVPAIYVAGATAISVFFHRLFSHRAFETSSFWTAAGLLAGTAVCTGSSINWKAAHAAHHLHADGPDDPHSFRGWQSVFLSYHQPRYSLRNFAFLTLAGDPLHRWLHENYWLFNGLVASALLSAAVYAGHPEAFVYAYTLPLGLILLAAGIHGVIAHAGDGTKRYAVNLPAYKWLVLDEWAHGFHHAAPREWDWGGPGSRLIAAIKTEGRSLDRELPASSSAD